MKLGFLIFFIAWYGMIFILFTAISNLSISDTTINYDFVNDPNTTAVTEGGAGGGGFGDLLAYFGRLFLFMVFGVGLPSDTPSYITIFWSVLTVGINTLFVGFIISAIWVSGG